jgi:hypothetical protein
MCTQIVKFFTQRNARVYRTRHASHPTAKCDTWVLELRGALRVMGQSSRCPVDIRSYVSCSVGYKIQPFYPEDRGKEFHQNAHIYQAIRHHNSENCNLKKIKYLICFIRVKLRYCLRSLGSRDRGFESHSGHACLVFVCMCAFFCVCVQVEALRRADHPPKES